MKAIKTANAIIPIDSILYAERVINRINIYVKGLSAPNNVVVVTFPYVCDAEAGLEELYKEMENWG